MELRDGNLMISESREEELETINKIYEEESDFFIKIEGEPGPTPYTCFSGNFLPPNKTKEDFKVISCYEDDDIIGWATIIRGYPQNDTYYITHFSILEQVRYNGYGRRFIKLLCDYFKENGFHKARLLVSLKNWDGLRFWYNCGFDKITYVQDSVSYSEHTFASMELEKTLG